MIVGFWDIKLLADMADGVPCTPNHSDTMENLSYNAPIIHV